MADGELVGLLGVGSVAEDALPPALAVEDDAGASRSSVCVHPCALTSNTAQARSATPEEVLILHSAPARRGHVNARSCPAGVPASPDQIQWADGVMEWEYLVCTAVKANA